MKKEQKSSPSFVAIAACDPSGVIGKGGFLPWHEVDDIEHFRKTTFQQVMIMGYNTYSVMPKEVLRERENIVFSKRHIVDSFFATQVRDLDELSALYIERRELSNKMHFVIGGAAIFGLFFQEGLIENALITHIHKRYEGDVYFPLEYLAGCPKELVQAHERFSVFHYIIAQDRR